MGGFGSGRWLRQTRKMTVEECQYLSAETLQREGLLKPGTAIQLEPSNGIRGFQYTSVGLKVWESQCRWTLVVEVQWNGIDTTIPIRLKRIPPHDARTAFVCPECERKYLKLYFRSSSLACRQCLDLTYWSCQHSGGRQVMKRIMERVQQKSRG